MGPSTRYSFIIETTTSKHTSSFPTAWNPYLVDMHVAVASPNGGHLTHLATFSYVLRSQLAAHGSARLTGATTHHLIRSGTPPLSVLVICIGDSES